MADYYSPTVVEPHIPLADMTPLEQLLLTQIFDSETIGDALYFYEEQSTQDQLWLDVGEVREALAGSEGIASKANEIVATALAELEPDAEDLELDLSMTSWEFLFQDIIARSATIEYVVVTTSFTSSKMRPDSFGGMVTLITADDMLSSSTSDMLGQLLDRVDYGDLGCAPGHGSHVALRLPEANVRATMGEFFDDEAPVGLAIDEVTNEDVRAACVTILKQCDLSHEQGELIVAAALHSIRIAAERRQSAL